jgi:hypothetical protein
MSADQDRKITPDDGYGYRRLSGQTLLVGRRNILAGIAGLGLAGGVGLTRVLAQDATPTDEPSTSDDQTTDTTDADGGDGKAGARYDDFVAKLAANLGSDADTVDTGIRDSLKAMVDDVFNAGDISKNAATRIKDRIDSAASPLAALLMIGKRGGDGGKIIRNPRGGRGGGTVTCEIQPGNDEMPGGTTEPGVPSSDSTPTT